MGGGLPGMPQLSDMGFPKFDIEELSTAGKLGDRRKMTNKGRLSCMIQNYFKECKNNLKKRFFPVSKFKNLKFEMKNSPKLIRWDNSYDAKYC